MKFNRKSTTLYQDSDKMMHSPDNLDKKLLQAYKNTDYILMDQNITIKIGQKNKELSYFLIDNKAYSFTFITAYNPKSKILSKEQNERANKSLEGKLKSLGFRCLSANAKDPKRLWPDEPGFIVLDLPLEENKKLAMSFKQNAVVYGNITIAPQLIAL